MDDASSLGARFRAGEVHPLAFTLDKENGADFSSMSLVLKRFKECFHVICELL